MWHFLLVTLQEGEAAFSCPFCGRTIGFSRRWKRKRRRQRTLEAVGWKPVLEPVDDILARDERSGGGSAIAEGYRLKGEWWLQLEGEAEAQAQAEASFQHAITIARQQEGKWVEFRAATSLTRLWQSQDKRQDAYDLLTPVYEWFTEGFDTADLIDAKTLLNELVEDSS
jgi:predicted ATPase